MIVRYVLVSLVCLWRVTALPLQVVDYNVPSNDDRIPIRLEDVALVVPEQESPQVQRTSRDSQQNPTFVDSYVPQAVQASDVVPLEHVQQSDALVAQPAEQQMDDANGQDRSKRHLHRKKWGGGGKGWGGGGYGGGGYGGGWGGGGGGHGGWGGGGGFQISKVIVVPVKVVGGGGYGHGGGGYGHGGGGYGGGGHGGWGGGGNVGGGHGGWKGGGSVGGGQGGWGGYGGGGYGGGGHGGGGYGGGGHGGGGHGGGGCGSCGGGGGGGSYSWSQASASSGSGSWGKK